MNSEECSTSYDYTIIGIPGMQRKRTTIKKSSRGRKPAYNSGNPIYRHLVRVHALGITPKACCTQNALK